MTETRREAPEVELRSPSTTNQRPMRAEDEVEPEVREFLSAFTARCDAFSVPDELRKRMLLGEVTQLIRARLSTDLEIPEQLFSWAVREYLDGASSMRSPDAPSDES